MQIFTVYLHVLPLCLKFASGLTLLCLLITRANNFLTYKLKILTLAFNFLRFKLKSGIQSIFMYSIGKQADRFVLLK